MKMVWCKKLWLMTVLAFLFACEDEMDKHYERPSWLTGNAYEVLQSRSNYSLFLNAIDKAGFHTIVNGQGLCSVFAPEDDQFLKYLNAHGWNTLEDVPEDSLKVLVGFHIVQYSYMPSDFLNFQPNGILNPPTQAGIYYKHQTFGKEPYKSIVDPVTGTKYDVYQQEKFLPVLSTELFHSKKLNDLEYNYKYFYPQGNWQGDGKFYPGNASILEGTEAIATDNGYLYMIDKTLQPTRNIYAILESHKDIYSTFRTLYDRFTKITYSASLTEKYSKSSSDSVFLYQHNILPMIASESTFNFEGGFSSNVGLASGTAFNVFIPDDNALNNYLNSFFTAYSSYADIPLMPVFYLLYNHVKSSNIIFPEEIKSGKISTNLGDAVDFDPDRAAIKELCTNGVFYGMDKVIEPAPFKSVTKPVFQKPEYNIFMHLLYSTGEIIQLTNPDIEYTLLVPPDDAFIAMGVQLNVGDVNVFGDEYLEHLDIETGNFVKMTALELSELVSLHIVPQKIEDFNTQSIYPVKKNLSYLKVYEGGVAGESHYGNPIDVISQGSFSNGATYEVNSVITKSSQTLVEILNSSEYSEFWDLLQQAGFIQDVNGVTITISTGETPMIFAPTNAAIITAKNNGVIPADSVELGKYLKYFFSTLERNKLSDYILPTFTESTGFDSYVTLAVDEVNSNIFETKYYEMELIPDDANFRLKLVNNTGTKTTYTLSGEYPRFASDGLIYQIESADIKPE